MIHNRTTGEHTTTIYDDGFKKKKKKGSKVIEPRQKWMDDRSNTN